MMKLVRFSGISAVTVLWLGISYGMYRVGLGLVDTRPISFIGAMPGTELLFSTTLALSAVFFMLFGYYLYKKYSHSKWFLATFVFGQLAQIVAAIFQYGGEDKRIHTVAAFMLAAAIPAYMLLFALSVKDQPLRKTAFRFYIAESIFFVVGIGAFIFAKGISPLAEILPALPFHAWVVDATFKN